MLKTMDEVRAFTEEKLAEVPEDIREELRSDLVVELVDGHDLAQRLAKERPDAPESYLRVVRTVRLDGLQQGGIAFDSVDDVIRGAYGVLPPNADRDSLLQVAANGCGDPIYVATRKHPHLPPGTVVFWNHDWPDRPAAPVAPDIETFIIVLANLMNDSDVDSVLAEFDMPEDYKSRWPGQADFNGLLS